MIKIEKPREKNCYCRCCQSANNVLEVEFNSETGGTHVALCENCRDELVNKIAERDLMRETETLGTPETFENWETDSREAVERRWNQ